MMGRRRGTSVFPAARIKKMMQADEDVGKIATVTPMLVAKALECMMEHLITEAAHVAVNRNSRTVSPLHLKASVMANDEFDFLRPVFQVVQGNLDDAAAVRSPLSENVSAPAPNKPFSPPPTTIPLSPIKAATASASSLGIPDHSKCTPLSPLSRQDLNLPSRAARSRPSTSAQIIATIPQSTSTLMNSNSPADSPPCSSGFALVKDSHKRPRTTSVPDGSRRKRIATACAALPALCPPPTQKIPCHSKHPPSAMSAIPVRTSSFHDSGTNDEQVSDQPPRKNLETQSPSAIPSSMSPNMSIQAPNRSRVDCENHSFKSYPDFKNSVAQKDTFRHSTRNDGCDEDYDDDDHPHLDEPLGEKQLSEIAEQAPSHSPHEDPHTKEPSTSASRISVQALLS